MSGLGTVIVEQAGWDPLPIVRYLSTFAVTATTTRWRGEKPDTYITPDICSEASYSVMASGGLVIGWGDPHDCNVAHGRTALAASPQSTSGLFAVIAAAHTRAVDVMSIRDNARIYGATRTPAPRQSVWWIHDEANTPSRVSNKNSIRPSLGVWQTVSKRVRNTPFVKSAIDQTSQLLRRRKRTQHPINTLQTHQSFAGERRVAGDFSHEIPMQHLLYGFSDGGLERIARHNDRQKAARFAYQGKLRIAWVHPMFGRGGGGHYNIFRCQKYLLRDFGIGSVNFLYPTPDSDISRYRLSEELLELATHYYDAEGTSFQMDWNLMDSCQVHMATTWASAYPILAQGGLLRSYFIQDYEPFFFAQGAKSYLADRSYDFGFFPICAGPWLPQQIGYVTGGKRQTNHCWYKLAVSSDDYFVTVPSNSPSRKGVCFYVRANTERRGFDLTLMTIRVLKERYPNIPIFTVGMHPHELQTLQGCIHMGILPINELQALYSQCAVYVVMSFTNYSLLPAEINACGGQVIDLDIPSNRASASLFDSSAYRLVAPDPYRIAEAIANPSTGETSSKASVTTWSEEYAKVGRAILTQFGRHRE